MKNLLLVLVIVLLASCSKNNVKTKNCGNIVCTENFAFNTIRFVNSAGEGITVKDYSVINQRTGKAIQANGGPLADVISGTYFVADDNSVKELSKNGDDLKVSGTDTVSHVTKTAIVKVAGGECACHIEKLSGPEEIKFD